MYQVVANILASVLGALLLTLIGCEAKRAVCCNSAYLATQKQIDPDNNFQEEAVGMTQLDSFEQLKARFEADSGKIRLITLLSPT